MALPHFEVASGPIDGVNQVFTVSVGYAVGSTAVFLNGQLKRVDFADGWVESNPAGGEVTLDQAPLVGDVVQMFFLDMSPALPGEEVTPLFGIIDEIDELSGQLLEVCPIIGVLEACDGV